MKIILPGGAGLIGQNLVVKLKSKGFHDLIVIDKHEANLNALKLLHPDVICIHADLSRPGEWKKFFAGGDLVVMLQAQIGGNKYDDFFRNNIQSTELILDVMRREKIPRLIHISSSVVKSVANDFYTNTKKAQEDLVLHSQIPHVILRPTLMFGWFDRKHIGWLSRLMKKCPIFPIPGNGKYTRQPLYAGDFCNVIIGCIHENITMGSFDISGIQYVDYIDIIKQVKIATKSSVRLIFIPYSLFYFLLWIWGCFDKAPPFTTQQLSALVTDEKFEISDWPTIFKITPTSFVDAIHETFNHPSFSQIILKF